MLPLNIEFHLLFHIFFFCQFCICIYFPLSFFRFPSDHFLSREPFLTETFPFDAIHSTHFLIVQRFELNPTWIPRQTIYFDNPDKSSTKYFPSVTKWTCVRCRNSCHVVLLPPHIGRASIGRHERSKKKCRTLITVTRKRKFPLFNPKNFHMSLKSQQFSEFGKFLFFSILFFQSSLAFGETNIFQN